MLNIKNLFSLQKVLDDRIVKENNITHDRFDILIMALFDELGECAKETRCFKDWSKKDPSPRAVILEEYVDGFHFILSIGLYNGFESEHEFIREHITANNIGVAEMNDRMIITQCFLGMYMSVIDYVGKDITYYDLISDYVYLGLRLGFTCKEIETAYFEKNEVNHKRQDEGY